MSEMKGLGHFRDKTHILPLRVYYEDTDLSGVVYHANYLRFIWLARLDDEEPVAWALRTAKLEFHRPARLDDPLEVHTACGGLTGARMSAFQKVLCNGNVLMEGEVEACIITLNGKPRRIPGEVREKLLPFLVETNT
jgi:acyl-CoA thioester hydrolase